MRQAACASILGLALLAGCSPSPSDNESPSPSPSPTETPSPSPSPLAEPAASPAAFDLICDGTVFNKVTDSHEPFATRFRVDPPSRRFCTDDCVDVFHLRRATARLLEYDYDVEVADEDHAANRFRATMLSSAGPNERKDSFAINLQTGVLARHYEYSAGDPAARQFDLTYDGQCVRAPFSGFQASDRP